MFIRTPMRLKFPSMYVQTHVKNGVIGRQLGHMVTAVTISSISAKAMSLELTTMFYIWMLLQRHSKFQNRNANTQAWEWSKVRMNLTFDHQNIITSFLSQSECPKVKEFPASTSLDTELSSQEWKGRTTWVNNASGHSQRKHERQVLAGQMLNKYFIQFPYQMDRKPRLWPI